MDDRSAFVDWARAHAVPLASTEPGSGADDLLPLLGLLGQRRIVGLGEATHGTREFFQLKHRLLELLVERAGFTQCQMEANLPDAMAVEDYVRHGAGAADVAVNSMHFWVWDTEEVLDLVEWLRERPVGFAGVDLQFAPEAARRLIGLLPPGLRERARTDLAPVLDPVLAANWRHLPAADRAHALGAFAELAGCCTGLAGETARSLLAFVESWAEFALPGDIWEQRRVRDREMAANAVRLAGDGRAVLWAHNQHVGRDGFHGRFPSMGGHLDAKLGRDYAPVGFAFARGGFRSFDSSGSLRDIWVDGPPAGSLEEALAEVGLPLFALRWDGLDGPARRWLAGRPRTRSIGADYQNDSAGDLLDADPSTEYDLLIYVDRTSPARTNPGGLRPPVAAPVVRDTPVNLDLASVDASVDPDGWPTGWARTEARAVGDYDVRVATADGGPALLVTRRDARWRNGKVLVHQSLSAAVWRGRTCTLRAELRREGPLEGGSVRLLVDSTGPDSGRRISISDPARPDGTWTDATASVQVPDDAETVLMGIAVTGSNPALVRLIALTG